MSDLFEYENGATSLDEGERQELIPALTTRAELNAYEYANILEARTWAFAPRRLSRLDPFEELVLRDVHRRMFRHTWKWAGKYRSTERNIGVPAFRIQSDLGALLGDARYWMEHATWDPTELAVRFHHRLVLIHPFSNGNGRHARMMADIVAFKLTGSALPWGVGTGSGPSIRGRYLAGLRAADAGDLAPLVEFARSRA